MKLIYRDRGTSGTQLDIYCGTLPICKIRKAVQSIDARGERWGWSWHVEVGPLGFSIHGRADSKPRRWQRLNASGRNGWTRRGSSRKAIPS